MLSPSELFDLTEKTPAEAERFLKEKKVKLSTGWKQVVKICKENGFTVANVTKVQLLTDIKGLISEAMQKGLDIVEFKKNFKNVLSENGWYSAPVDKTLDTNWRMNLIFRMNTNSAFAAGRLAKSQTTKSIAPCIKLNIVLDKNTTDRCRYFANKKMVFSLSDKLLRYIHPLRHWGCRTDALPQTPDMIELFKLKITPIKTIPMEFRNHKDFQELPKLKYVPNLIDMRDKYDADIMKEYEK